MLSYNDAFYGLRNNLQSLYDAQEAAAIAHELMYAVTGLDKLKRLSEKDSLLTDEHQLRYDEMQAALLTGKPLQYVIGESWFMGRKFKVNEHVLIPRPETEELVQWITDDWKNKQAISILDIGTGSGCIPVSLKSGLPGATVAACDISEGALDTAKDNARSHGADISFIQLNFLHQTKRVELPAYDVIVSNPPYIPVTEQDSLHKNVRDFEPALALFVPGDDALLFYREIALFGETHLKAHGAIYCELHVDHAIATKELFEQAGYASVEIRKDMHGNLRMLKAM
jgi:release factor glutamine methyltransferase